MERGLDRGFPASRLELVGGDANVLHVRPQHEVYQVLVFLVDLGVFGVIFAAGLEDWWEKKCEESELDII